MAQQPKIEAYEFGRIVIDGRTYTADVIILPTGVKSNWWRKQGHSLCNADLADVLPQPPDVLIIGQGAHGQMSVPSEMLSHLERTGIETACAPTGQAVELYNERCQGGGTVAAALHLTC